MFSVNSPLGKRKVQLRHPTAPPVTFREFPGPYTKPTYPYVGSQLHVFSPNQTHKLRTTMKPSATITSSTATLDVVKAPNFVRVTAITIFSFSVITLLYLFPSSPFPSSISFSPSFSITSPQQIKNNASLVSPRPKKTRPPPPPTVGERTGIVDENGAMAEDFVIGEFDPSAMDEFRNLTGGREETSTKEDGKLTRVKYERFRVCEESTRDYIPCLDNVEEIKRLNLSGSLVIYERHCPEEGKRLDCLVPMPKGYKRSIPWPRSRDEVIL
jgi:hypothetical protein